jgi:hypothetical protein
MCAPHPHFRGRTNDCVTTVRTNTDPGTLQVATAHEERGAADSRPLPPRVAYRPEIQRSLAEERINGNVRENFPGEWYRAQTQHGAGNPWYRRLFGQTGEGEVLIEGSVPASAVYSPLYVWGTRLFRAVAVVGVAVSGRKIYKAAQTGDADTVVDVTVSEASAWGGGYAGAEVGASLGVLVGGPFGAAIGGIGGGIAGAVGGQIAGSLLHPGFNALSQWAHQNIHAPPGSPAVMTVMPGGVIDTFGGPGSGTGLSSQLRYLEVKFGPASHEANRFRQYMQQVQHWQPPLIVPHLPDYVKDALRAGGYP